MAERLYFVLSIATTFLLLVTFGYAIYLGVLTNETRTGRVVFGTIASLKLFVLLILANFFVSYLAPAFTAEHRTAIRVGLVVYLLVQSLGTFIALRRLQVRGER